MPNPQLKPIEKRDHYAAMVMNSWDKMHEQTCAYCGGAKQYMDCEGMPRMCNECLPPTLPEIAEALRKAVLWGEAASNHIKEREQINWRYLEEAKEAYAKYLKHAVSFDAATVRESPFDTRAWFHPRRFPFP